MSENFENISFELNSSDVLFAEESYKIRGAVYQVYKTLGCGFLEPVYQEALEIELKARGIPFRPQMHLPIMYRGQVLKQYYQADIVCYDKIILELKALSNITGEHRAQLMNYLKITKIKLGFLINFGHFPEVEIQRMVV